MQEANPVWWRGSTEELLDPILGTARYFCDPSLAMSMSDAIGRPIWMQTPAGDAGGFGGFQIAGSPVRVVSWMPDVEPGSTPILFADSARTRMTR